MKNPNSGFPKLTPYIPGTNRLASHTILGLLLKATFKGSISKIQPRDFRNERLTLRTLTALIRTLFLGLLLKAVPLHIRDQLEKSKFGISQIDALYSGY
ncbi:hypothetical protein [Lentilactobacillus hilgardii]|uniref:Uncharacterized protein n=1 Tax=Lentilactobacillus hilgardii TaxID=1588 RepID=A0A6P1E8Y5_LENHI|nr:hypothetical protein [Lentilactobacillus hilgardii]QHB51183.1 hypothetical protein GQR93_02560 [Lentilactobacillus hilgardii]